MELRPPLEPAWTQPVGRAAQDPPLVAGEGRVVVPTAGTDAVCLDARDGAPVWQARRCRRREYECQLAGGRAFAFRGMDASGGYETTVLDASSGAAVVLKVPGVVVGVYARDGHDWAWMRDEEVRLDTLEVRPRALPLFGKVRDGRLFGRRAMTGETRLGCWDPARDEPVWEVETTLPEDAVSVGLRALVTHRRDRRFCVRSPEDGRLLWDVETLQSWETHTPWALVAERALHVEEEDRLAAHDVLTGALAWERRARGRWSNLVATDRLVWAARETASRRFELVAFEIDTGAEVWAGAVPAEGPRCLLAMTQGTLLCDLKRTLLAWRGAPPS